MPLRPRRLLPLFLLLALLPLRTSVGRGEGAEQLDFGVRAAKKGLWREALFRWEKARKLAPDNSRVLNNLAVAYETNGDFEKAEELYKEALKSEPDNRDIKQNYELFSSYYRELRSRKERDQAKESPAAAQPADKPDLPPEQKTPDAPPSP